MYNKQTKKFIKLYNILSIGGKLNLVYKPYSKNPLSLNVICLEIINKTKLGKKILKEIIKDSDQEK